MNDLDTQYLIPPEKVADPIDPDEDLIQISGVIYKETTKGLCIGFVNNDGELRKEWFPKSQLVLTDTHDTNVKSYAKATMRRWLADEKSIKV